MPPRQNYRRLIVADLIRQIEDGTLAPGQKLPTQEQLAEQYGCSLEPVKAALDRLQDHGYVEKHQGKGMYVADPPPASDDLRRSL